MTTPIAAPKLARGATSNPRLPKRLRGKESAAPFVFDAKAVVADAGKNRERDVIVQLADGKVTVSDKNHALVTTVRIARCLASAIPRSKQPLWNSPSGPAEVLKVDGGALRFLKGNTIGRLKGGRHWLALRTTDASDRPARRR